MSGIAAIALARGQTLDADHFARWARTLEEVGPHGLRVQTLENVGLAHSLCRIYAGDGDLPQPASMAGVWISADARLDAISQLRDELLSSGRSVRAGATDAELLLHSYAAWGEECVDHLLGDFAFIIWDAGLGRLFAATDHFSAKPLYYAAAPERMIVSNWGPTLYAHPDVDVSPDDSAIVHFLRGGYMAPEATAFSGIRVLNAAHRLTWSNGETRVERYWSPPIEEPLYYRDGRQYTEELLALLEAAVGDRLRGGKASIQLSGGLDSPLVASVARSLTRGAEGLTAHTAVFDHMIPDDERRFARAVADHLGIPIAFHPVDDYLPFSRAMNLTNADPVLQNSPFRAALYDLTGAGGADANVVLTGDGTDAILAPESLVGLLAGSHIRELLATVRHAPGHVRAYGRRPPLALRRSLTWLRGTRAKAFQPAENPPWLRPELAVHAPSLQRRPAKLHPYRDYSYRIISGPLVPASIGHMAPVASALHMSCAYPYLDLRVVRFGLRLPSVPWCWDKHVVRNALRGRVPPEVVTRRKTPLQGNVLTAALERFGFDWMSGLAPGLVTSRYYAWPDFTPLRRLMEIDAHWEHSRPLALELFWRSWSARSRVT